MAIKLHKVTIPREIILMAVLVILSEGYFGLKQMTVFERLLIGPISLYLIIKGINKGERNRSIDKWALAFAGAVVISAVAAVINGYVSFTQAVYYNYINIVAVVVSCVGKSDRTDEFVVKLLKTLSFAVSLLLLLQYIFAGFGIYFFQENTLSLRGGNIRILSGAWLISIGFIMFLYEVLMLKHRKYTVHLIVSLFSIVVVNQSRSLIFAISLAAIFIVIESGANYMKKNWTSKLAVILLILLLGCYMLYTAYKLFNTSLSLGESSSAVRLSEYAYYFDLFKRHILFGFSNHDSSYMSAPDYWGAKLYGYCVNDIGIVGYAAEYGTLGLVMAVLGFYILWKNAQRQSLGRYVLIFVLAIMPFNCLFYGEFVIFIPLIMGLIEYYNRCVLVKEQKLRRNNFVTTPTDI